MNKNILNEILIMRNKLKIYIKKSCVKKKVSVAR